MKRTIHLALTGILVFSALCLSAQGFPPPYPGSESAPIDNGALFLLIGAVGYGYMRLRQKEKAGV